MQQQPEQQGTESPNWKNWKALLDAIDNEDYPGDDDDSSDDGNTESAGGEAAT